MCLLAPVRALGQEEPAAAIAPAAASTEAPSRPAPKSAGAATPKRARWGVGGFGGVLFPATPLCFPVGGVEYRVGAQVTHQLALLGTAAVGLGGGAWDGVVKTAGWTSFGFLAELSLTERVFVAAGPGVALGLWGAPFGAEVVLYDEVHPAGVFLSADVRLGVGLGGLAGPLGSRRHLTLGLDLLVLVGFGSRTVPSESRPWDVTYRTEAVVAFVPALTLGYDVR